MTPLAWPMPNGKFRAEVYHQPQRRMLVTLWLGEEHDRKADALAQAQAWIDAQNIDAALAQRALEEQP